jgi:glycosyltransferase involved in cell wall biosynthesis
MSRDPVELFINGRFLTQDLTGVQRYASEIVKALDDLLLAAGPGAPKCRLLAPKGADAAHLGLKSIEFATGGPLSGHPWEQTWLAAAASGGVLVNLCNSGPVLHPRTLTVIHDAVVYRMPQHFSANYRRLHQTLGRVLGRNSRIATVSHFSQGELGEVLGIDPARIAVIPNGTDHIARVAPDDSVTARKGLQAGRYFLFVGSPAPHKNLAAALKAFSGLSDKGMTFVVVGAAKSKVFGDGGLDVPDNVVFTGRLTDEEIAGLYRQAAAFIFPSFYEGFGPRLSGLGVGYRLVPRSLRRCRPVLSTERRRCPDEPHGPHHGSARNRRGPAQQGTCACRPLQLARQCGQAAGPALPG